MNLNSAISITIGIIGIVLFINAFELLFLSLQKKFNQVWKYQDLKSELNANLPLPNRLIDLIFSDRSFQFIAASQLILTVSLLFTVNVWIILGLLITHLLICIRFRGTFNGGSDMMIMVILTGSLISLADPSTRQAGMIYIGIHALYSYFKAGIVKIRAKVWRQGTAISIFLNRSQYTAVRTLAEWLAYKPQLGKILCWGVIVFELSVVVLLFAPEIRMFYFCIALVFHFGNFLAFGLNRFFWTWIAAWPAIAFSLMLIKVSN